MNNEYSDFVIRFRGMTGIDLYSYSQPQIMRRLTSYQQKYSIDSLEELLGALASDPLVLKDFIARLTINTSDFFRDREYWQALRVKTASLAGARLPLRFWSAGCATGEEPYSLAFMLFGLLPRRSREILASDLSHRALTVAAEGVYPKKALKNLSSEEIGLFFYPIDSNNFKVKDFLREGIEFFQHNLLADPFPTNLDVVLCRNVIIYFKEAAKRKIIAGIARQLNPGGLLFIGGSEQILAPAEFDLQREDIYIYKKLA